MAYDMCMLKIDFQFVERYYYINIIPILFARDINAAPKIEAYLSYAAFTHVC